MRDGLGRIQSVAILGGDSDIGVAIARRMVGDLGAERIVLAGRDITKMLGRASEIHVEPEVVRFDATDMASHEDTFERIFAAGDIDVVVIAFGVLGDEGSGELVREMATVNFLGAFAVSLSVADRLRRQGHGHLVGLSSFAVVRPRPDNYRYGSTKAGIDFLWRGLLDDLQTHGVSCTIVRPGFVKTKMTAGNKAAPFAITADAVAAVVAHRVRRGISGVAWAPKPLKYVGAVIRALPMRILRRLSNVDRGK